jgi:hypothetical protein
MGIGGYLMRLWPLLLALLVASVMICASYDLVISADSSPLHWLAYTLIELELCPMSVIPYLWYLALGATISPLIELGQLSLAACFMVATVRFRVTRKFLAVLAVGAAIVGVAGGIIIRIYPPVATHYINSY